MTKKTSRRQFLATAAATTGAALAVRSIPAWARPAAQAQAAITPQLSVFGYSQVQLLDSPFRRQFDQNHDLFLHLDEDAMLKPFRQRGGLLLRATSQSSAGFCPKIRLSS